MRLPPPALLCFLSAVLAFAGGGSLPASERPNIVVIFIDDMGYGDVGFNGATGPKTPNLDRMAAEGMRFDHFYVGCAVCSGSRTALLTGCHYQRLSMSAVLFPRSNEGLHPDEVTIADMLGDTGYRTACVGKWHLGHLPPCLPTYQGFDSYFGVPYSNDMWIDPANRLADDLLVREGLTLEEVRSGHKKKNLVPLMRGEEVVEYPADQATLTKRYTEESIRFIRESGDTPFFLYLPHTMVHLPLAASEAFAGRTGKPIWDAIEEVDWSVGEILRALRDEGLAEKTLVVFTSDNGAAVGSSLPLRAKKGSVYDGGIREPTVMWWPGTVPAGSVCDEVAATIDLLPTFAKLCGGSLPDRRIDGHDISPLLLRKRGARSPHESYVLLHGPGTVRSGPWKFYPWPEKTDGRDGVTDRVPSPEPVQLYHVIDDIGETRNLASRHPQLVRRLQSTYDAHLAEIQANRRPTAKMERPENPVASPDLDRSRDGKSAKPLDWSKVRTGDVFPANRAPDVSRSTFAVTATVDSENPAGVIIAHGGSVVGYSLYVKEGQAVFAVRLDDSRVVRAKVPLEAGKSEIVARVDREGDLRITVNENDSGKAGSSALLPRHPSESLCIGHDDRNPVDPEAPGGRFQGTIRSVKVERILAR